MDTLIVPFYEDDGTRHEERVDIVATIDAFVVHATLLTSPLPDPGYTVTHAPTRLGCIEGLPLDAAIQCARRFARSELDWSMCDPAALTALHWQVGQAIVQEYLSLRIRAYRSTEGAIAQTRALHAIRGRTENAQREAQGLAPLAEEE